MEKLQKLEIHYDNLVDPELKKGFGRKIGVDTAENEPSKDM